MRSSCERGSGIHYFLGASTFQLYSAIYEKFLKKPQLLFLELHKQDESSYCITWCPAQVAAHQNRPVHSLAASHKGKQPTKELVQELVVTSKILIGKCIFILLAACCVFHYIPCYLASVFTSELEISLEYFIIFILLFQ